MNSALQMLPHVATQDLNTPTAVPHRRDLEGAVAAMGSEKKSPPAPPREMWPSLPRCTVLGFGCSSSIAALNAKRLGPEATQNVQASVMHGMPNVQAANQAMVFGGTAWSSCSCCEAQAFRQRLCWAVFAKAETATQSRTLLLGLWCCSADAHWQWRWCLLRLLIE